MKDAVKRHLVILTAAQCTSTAASDAYAHHSDPYFYDQCKSITIEGRVESVQWKDPHSLIVLGPDDGAASKGSASFALDVILTCSHVSKALHLSRQCRSLPASASVPTRSFLSWETEGWARSTKPTTLGWAATSRSRSRRSRSTSASSARDVPSQR